VKKILDAIRDRIRETNEFFMNHYPADEEALSELQNCVSDIQEIVENQLKKVLQEEKLITECFLSGLDESEFQMVICGEPKPACADEEELKEEIESQIQTQGIKQELLEKEDGPITF